MSESAWTVIGTIAVGVLGAIVGAYLKVSGVLHTQRKEVREQSNKDLRIVIDELRETLEDKNKECHDLRDKLNLVALETMDCRVDLSREKERREWLEDLLTRNGIAFKRWNPDSSSSMDVEG